MGGAPNFLAFPDSFWSAPNGTTRVTLDNPRHATQTYTQQNRNTIANMVINQDAKGQVQYRDSSVAGAKAFLARQNGIATPVVPPTGPSAPMSNPPSYAPSPQPNAIDKPQQAATTQSLFSSSSAPALDPGANPVNMTGGPAKKRQTKSRSLTMLGQDTANIGYKNLLGE